MEYSVGHSLYLNLRDAVSGAIKNVEVVVSDSEGENYSASSDDQGIVRLELLEETYKKEGNDDVVKVEHDNHTITVEGYSPVEINTELFSVSGNVDNPRSIIFGNIRADVDNNKTVNIIDALLTFRNSLGLDMSETNWDPTESRGDVDCSGSVNSSDAMLLLRYSLGLSMSGTDWCE